MGKVVLVGSQKRDVGKTIICIKAGIELSQGGKKVLLVDLSSGKKKMSEYLKVNEEIIYDVKDVLDTTCFFNQAVIETSTGPSLLPAPRIIDKLAGIKLDSITKLFNEAKEQYDVVIADVDSISLSYVDLNAADIVLSVNNNDFSCVKEINSEKTIASKYNVDILCAVINRYNKKQAKRGNMMNVKEIQKMTELNIQAVIEENSKYAAADYNFLLSNEENSFNKAIRTYVKSLI